MIHFIGLFLSCWFTRFLRPGLPARPATCRYRSPSRIRSYKLRRVADSALSMAGATTTSGGSAVGLGDVQIMPVTNPRQNITAASRAILHACANGLINGSLLRFRAIALVRKKLPPWLVLPPAAEGVAVLPQGHDYTPRSPANGCYVTHGLTTWPGSNENAPAQRPG